MSKGECDIRIGTSGWHYDHWRKRFYPDKLAKNKWLAFFAEHFNTVEVNNTFYQLPKESTFENWYRQGPADFLYAVKANRYITHIKRLKDTSAQIKRFFSAVNILKEKLGPVLYQLPPNLKQDLDLLKTFMKSLPKNRRGAFEFRHQSWFADDTFELLNKFDMGFCVHDMPGIITPRVVTAKLIYIRFHGSTGKYQGNYSNTMLMDWAMWIKEHKKKVANIYAYFNNDVDANAIANAKTLRELIFKDAGNDK